MKNIIKNRLMFLIKNEFLTDAHRHSFYDINKVKNMKGLAVEEWTKNIDFDKFTKSLKGKQLEQYIEDWLKFSYNENIRTIIDFSAKRAQDDLKSIYDSYKIKSFLPIKWTDINKISMNYQPDFIMLPDERDISIEILQDIKSVVNRFPNIRLTMHCLESEYRKNLIYSKFGISTIELLKKFDLLSNKLFLVHLNEVTINDIELIKKFNVKIVLCPLIRDAFDYKTPTIPPYLDIYFGTDVPLISGNRSIVDVAVKQIEIWIENGMKQDQALILAKKILTKNI